MKITHNPQDRSFRIEFKYDRVLVDAIRAIPGRAYDPKAKNWKIPEASHGHVARLKEYGFIITPEVQSILSGLEESYRRRVALADMSDINFETSLPLRNYQRIGASFLNEIQSGLLAYDVGTGKTLIALALASKCSGKILVVCPNTLKLSWLEEKEKWFADTEGISNNLSAVVISGTAVERAAQWKKSTQIYIANYECFLHDKEPFAMEWDLVVCDEATRLANPSTKTTKALLRLQSKRRIAMTGTPVSNRPDDIWSIINWTNSGALGTYWNFQNRYCVKNHWNAIVGYRDLDRFAEEIRPYFIRRTKEQVLDELPNKVSIDVITTLSKDEQRIYNAIKEELIFELKNHETNRIQLASLGNAITRLLRLKQITGSCALIGEADVASTKIEALKQKISEISDAGEKAIVFTQFAELIPILTKELSEYNPVIIRGEVSLEDRQKNIEIFRNDPTCKILLSTEAGGEGLNLQVANHICHFDMPWSIAKTTQRTGRAHRMGQTRTVFEYFFIAEKTVDEYVRKTLYKKQSMSEKLTMGVEDIEQILGI